MSNEKRLIFSCFSILPLTLSCDAGSDVYVRAPFYYIQTNVAVTFFLFGFWFVFVYM